ncbi:MAG: hypothetical protein WBE89_18390, partial [Methyloceanibacter sp.]
ERASTLFVDYASLAVGAHVAHTYGNMRTIAHPVRGGLAALARTPREGGDEREFGWGMPISPRHADCRRVTSSALSELRSACPFIAS